MKEKHEMYGDVRAAIIHNSAVDYSQGRLLVIDCDGVTRELYDDGYRKQSEWISVEDRLPKTYESVLVYMPGETPNPTVHEGFLNRFGRWYAGGFDRLPDEVVMWMPLPEPPEMKGGE
jgi:hypothetical protein